MIKIDDTNATSIPSPNTASCEAVNASPNLTSFNKLAPNITGIAKKNVNSAATVRLTPNINPGLPLAAVSWGFRGRQALAQAGAAVIVDTAAELLDTLL